ncbi:MAG: PIN domain-containing protein [Thermodesulfobacteriota bacterium]|nr:PIN domain-containing protein [Thermodesulfobacteriota bacterium]
MKIKVYLDICSWYRPFDDQSQIRIRMEAEAVQIILEMSDLGQIEISISDIILYENMGTKDLVKMQNVKELMKSCKNYIPYDQNIQKRAFELSKDGFAPLDALHLASAETGGAEYFVTTDDKFQKRYDQLHDRIRTKVLNPIDFVKGVDI